MRQRLISLGIAIAIVVVVFPEVLFLGGSLSPVGLNDTLTSGASHRTVQVYPNFHNRAPSDDIRDVGARVWQLVPATKFMHRAISKGESPFWNPYSAAGSYGPETLADLKLSPFVLAVAALGASATAFTFVVLLLIVLALYCMQQLITYSLRLGRLAAVGACIVWLLNGFGASDINSAPGAPYLLFPVLLYALVSYRRKGGVPRFLAAVAAFVAFLLTTFVPTQLLMLVLVYAVALPVDAPNWRAGQSVGARIATILKRHVVVPAVALCVSAYVWLPNLAVLDRGASGFSNYSQRSLGTTGPLSFLRRIITPLAVSGGHWLTYVGIVPIILIAGAWPRSHGLRRQLLTVTGAMALFAIALHAGLPGVRLIGDIPGLRAVRQDYWAALAGAAESLAVGVSIGVMREKGMSRRAVGVTGALLVVWLFGTAAGEFALGHPGLSLAVCFATLLIIVTMYVAGASAPAGPRRRTFTIGAVCLLALELLIYQNHARVERFDAESPPPRYVTFLERHLHGERILDAGRAAIYPEWGTVLGIPQIGTLNVSQIPAYSAFFHSHIESTTGLFLEVGSLKNKPYRVQAAALDLLSVRYIVTDGSMPRFDAGVRLRYPLVFTDRAAHVKVYANRNPFPRAYLSPVLAGRSGSTLRTPFAMKSTRTSDPVLLAAARDAGIPTAPETAARGEAARITSYHDTRVAVAVDAPKASVLVLTDAYAPGWHVTVNGKAQHLARVDEIMRGVVVPAGKSTVVFTYRSAPRSIGKLISLLTLGLLLVYAIVVGIRKRRARAIAVTGADY